MPTALINNKVDSLTTKLIDFHQRRITNADDAVDDQDYVTFAQLKQYIKGLAQAVNQNVFNNSSSISITTTAITDLHSLTTNLNITPSVAPAAGKVLIVILKQDGTGNRIPTWSSDFSIVPSDINTTANKPSCIIFGVDENTKYTMIAAPMLET